MRVIEYDKKYRQDFIDFRPCFKNGKYAQGRGIFSPIKARSRRNTLCISRLSNDEWRKKPRLLGMLSIFQTGPNSAWIIDEYERGDIAFEKILK